MAVFAGSCQFRRWSIASWTGLCCRRSSTGHQDHSIVSELIQALHRRMCKSTDCGHATLVLDTRCHGLCLYGETVGMSLRYMTAGRDKIKGLSWPVVVVLIRWTASLPWQRFEASSGVRSTTDLGGRRFPVHAVGVAN